MSLKISGASDDLIEVDGDIDAEFNSDDELLVASTGHVFRIEFGHHGWSVRLLVGDSSTVTWSRIGEDDEAVLSGDVEWVVCDNELQRRGGDG